MILENLGDLMHEAKKDDDAVDAASHHKGYKSGYSDAADGENFNDGGAGDADHEPSFKKGYARGYGHGQEDCPADGK